MTKEKTPHEQTAAARQSELIAKALKGAVDGYWMNVTGKMPPRLYSKDAKISPFNSLILTLAADHGGHATAIYTSFNEVRKQGGAVLKEERSVPMNWYRWDTYVNRNDERERISRDEYKALEPEKQKEYRAIRQREIRSLFNLEQTSIPYTDTAAFEKLKQQYGGIADRGNLKAEQKQLQRQVADFRRQMIANLVPIRKSTTGDSYYNPAKDAVYLPDQKHFSEYRDYVQELMRQTFSATGHRERLAREGLVMDGGKAPSEYALRYERLITEIASGVKMAELGLPARLSPQGMELAAQWVQELRESPKLIDAIESDVNNALDVIRKAEKGERMEFAHERNSRETAALREDKRMQVSEKDALVFQDILRYGGMAIDERNFPDGKEGKRAFMEKFSLDLYEKEVQENLALAAAESDPEMKDIAYTQAGDAAANIERICSELLPRESELKGAHFITEEIDKVPDRRSKEFVVVKDKWTGITDVILPGGVLSGGHIEMLGGDQRPYRLNPDEVMTAEERQEAGAKVVSNDIPGFSKEKITAALTAEGATYVRFFANEGHLSYHPNDGTFEGKEVSSAKLNGSKLEVTSRIDVTEAVKRATEVQFDHIQMLKDNNGYWALYLKPHGGKGFAVYPDKGDLNRFFTTLKQNDRKAAGEVRNELAQKYYVMATRTPQLKTNPFGSDASAADLACILRVNLFRAKDGRFLCLPVIQGVDKLQAREVSKEQWQRLWITDDANAYKANLAAKLFADVLQQKQVKVGEENYCCPIKVLVR